LQFDVVRGRSLDRQIEQLKAGELDVLPVVTPSSEREAELQFTRAYLNNPFVLISATTAGSPRSLDDLQDKRLAFIAGIRCATTWCGACHDSLVEVRSPAEGMELIVKGQADATVSSLLVARFLLARQYRERLRITNTVGDQPARIALATAPQATALHT
jgi:two-component system sensor histidine kinase EvgS